MAAAAGEFRRFCRLGGLAACLGLCALVSDGQLGGRGDSLEKSNAAFFRLEVYESRQNPFTGFKSQRRSAAVFRPSPRNACSAI